MQGKPAGNTFILPEQWFSDFETTLLAQYSGDKKAMDKAVNKWVTSILTEHVKVQRS